MPQDARALTRAARARAAATGDPYTKARDEALLIQELADQNGWTYAEAAEFYDDPANQVACEDCGWTNGMLCPECRGCGCYNGRCGGWRHSEYAHEDELAAERDDCVECGGGAGPYDECICS